MGGRLVKKRQVGHRLTFVVTKRFETLITILDTLRDGQGYG